MKNEDISRLLRILERALAQQSHPPRKGPQTARDVVTMMRKPRVVEMLRRPA